MMKVMKPEQWQVVRNDEIEISHFFFMELLMSQEEKN